MFNGHLCNLFIPIKRTPDLFNNVPNMPRFFCHFVYIFFDAAGWTDFWKFSAEYFDNNTIWKIVKIFRNMRILSEF